MDLLLINNSQLIIYYSKVHITDADEFCSDKLNTLPYEFGNQQYMSVVQLSDGLVVAPAQQIVHLADINTDGYPDLLIQLAAPGEAASPYFLYNEPSDQNGDL